MIAAGLIVLALLGIVVVGLCTFSLVEGRRFQDFVQREAVVSPEIAAQQERRRRIIKTPFQARKKRLLGPQLARALPQIASALKSGASPSRAVQQVGDSVAEPLSSELLRVANEAAWTGDVGMAMEGFAQRVGGSDAALLAAAVSACQEKGGSLATVFEDVGKVMDQRQELRAYAQSQTASARLEAWLLFAMVVVLFVVLCIIQEGFAAFYLTITGLIIAVLTVAVSLVGVVAIYRIAHVDVD